MSLYFSVSAEYSQLICKDGRLNKSNLKYVTFAALLASGIYPPHSSIHLLNEPCQHSFPFLLLQLLSLNLVIDDAFVFCFLFAAYAIGVRGKQALGRFVRTKF